MLGFISMALPFFTCTPSPGELSHILMALHTSHMLMIPNFISLAQTYFLISRLKYSTAYMIKRAIWRSNKNLEFDMSETETLFQSGN